MNTCVFLILSLVLACQSNVDSPTVPQSAMAIQEYHFSQSENMTPYLSADISYFQLVGNSDFVNVVNNKILGAYTGQAEGIPKDPNILVEAYFEQQTNEIKQMIQELGESNWMPYSYLYNASVVLNNDLIFTFSQQAYEYTGGAHGNNWVKFSNFDVPTATLLSINNLFNDKEILILKTLAEKSFRKVKEMSDSESLEEAGYQFEGGFYLPKNFILEAHKIRFYFAPYEIGPYSLGDADFGISYEILKNEMPKAKLFNYVN